jgi:hypothetical protein
MVIEAALRLGASLSVLDKRLRVGKIEGFWRWKVNIT